MPASGTGRTVRLALAEPLGAWLAVLLPGLPVLLLRAIPDVGAITVAEAEADVVRILAVHAGLFGYVAFATSLVLAILAGYRTQPTSILDQPVEAPAAPTVPAEPAEPSAPLAD